jgi:RNA polymerase-binding protein DksA
MAKQKTLTERERKELEKERQQTIYELERLREYIRDQAESSSDEPSLAVYEREKNLALVRRLESRLTAIEDALRAAKKGRYGICERCGRPIDPERLKALPETTLCVRCKNELEKEARRLAARE